MNYIVEGVDRLGKSTLIEALKNRLGPHLVIHLSKPAELDCLGGSLEWYQRSMYTNYFNLLSTGTNLVFDRGHLGEVVYSPRYRGYNGDYVFDLESQINNTKLILLTTSDFSFVKDDGLSFDFSKKELEQKEFKAAFERSRLAKVLVDVSAGNGTRKSVDRLLDEILHGSIK